MDARFGDPDLHAFFGSGFIIHEVHFNPDVAFHTDIRRLHELPADLQRRIHLIHYGDDFRRHDPSPMRYLEQGRVYLPFEE